MNLLLLDQFSDPGGAQRCLLDLLPAVRDAGWRALVGLPGDGELFDRVRALGVPTSRITCGPYASGRKSPADLARFLAGTPVLARQIRRLADEIDADAIYLNGPRLLPAAALHPPGVPVIFHSHSLVPPGPMRRLAGASLRRLNARVIASCRFVADPWRAYVPDDRIAVVYNGVAAPDPVVRRTNPAAPRVGCLGRIAPEKGQLAFVAAARIIHRALPQARFVIQGAVLFADRHLREYEARVREAAAGLPIEFAGWTSDIYAALADLDLLLVPSSQEATTRVILEAFAAGVPVVAFAVGGIPEVITPRHDGFLSTTVEEMAQTAIDFLRRPDPALALRAQDTWRCRFTVDRYREDLLPLVAARPASD